MQQDFLKPGPVCEITHLPAFYSPELVWNIEAKEVSLWELRLGVAGTILPLFDVNAVYLQHCISFSETVKIKKNHTHCIFWDSEFT